MESSKKFSPRQQLPTTDNFISSKLSNTFDFLIHAYNNLTYLQIFAIFFALVIARIAFSVIYNLYFHPLRHFPGPFWGKVTIFYECYWDNIKDGVFTTHCYENLHPKYGSIIRVAPNKLRVNSADDFFKIHAVGTKFTKDPGFYAGINQSESVITFTENKPHRERRRLLAPLFSKKTIVKLQPLVREKIARLLDRVKTDENEAKQRGERYVFDSCKTYQAIVSDIIMNFAFGKSYDALGQKSLTHPILEIVAKMIEGLPNIKYAPAWVLSILKLMPLRLAILLWKPTATIRELEENTFADVVELFNKKQAGLLKPRTDDEPPTVFSELIETYPSEQALSNDSTIIFAAGTITTAYSLALGTYHLAKNPKIHERIFEEIKSIWPVLDQQPDYEELEKLPYFTAAIKEILRFSPGVVGGLARKTPPGGATLSGKFVPEHISVDSSLYNMNNNPDFFPDPFKFDPERWLQPNAKSLEKYSVGFGFGSRNCVGIYLAYLEIYMILSAVIRNFEFECTEALEEEGWLWVDRWVAAKRGNSGTFYFRSRTE